MAVAALLLWLCTAAVGSYMLVTAAHAGSTDEEADAAEPVPEPAQAQAQATVTAGTAAAAPDTRKHRDAFAPPSLQQARSEPLPGLRDLAEFAHPALAMIGIGFWLGYVVSHKELFAVIGLGILLGAICAGLSLHTVNARAVKRAAASAGTTEGTGTTAPDRHDAPPLNVSSRVLAVHAIGATLTLLLAVLIAVRG